MLRACFTQGPAAATASSSTRAQLHTSTALQAESARRRQTRLTKQTNVAKRIEIEQRAAAARPHVVLGTVSGHEDKWASCDLARALVRPDELAGPAASAPLDGGVVSLPSAAGDVPLPRALNYGIAEGEQRLLFAHLPVLSADMGVARIDSQSGFTLSSQGAKFSAVHDAQMSMEARNARALARLVDLRNANAPGIAYENRRRVVAEFSEPGKPNDTGRPEVQAALLTLQIRNLWEHLSKFKKDIANRRSLRQLVHKRAKILRYLKRVDRDRYDAVLERLALEPGSVEGELVV
ncbi:mitochondrial ribosomal protein S15 [Auriscalpium vulgare]|uniref:Mitochondrial ribosomal protein S15 n=1 Tax=Auriscalpium vulgare TaxID=40419 RepID=A0ACB8RNI3_9AGAM|nr:mitochondrial ribosomal protein S15 [Auriscalpium vulgare]